MKMAIFRNKLWYVYLVNFFLFSEKTPYKAAIIRRFQGSFRLRETKTGFFSFEPRIFHVESIFRVAAFVLHGGV